MAVIKFSNGQSVNFNGQPTQADVEEIATKLGIHAPTPAPNKAAAVLGSSGTTQPGALASASKGLFSAIPGATAIGQSLKTAGQNIGLLAQGKVPNIPVDIPKTIGGYLEAGSAVAGAAVNPASTIGKIAAGAAVGAAQGGGSTLANGGGVSDTLKSTLFGAGIGGAATGAMVGLGKLLPYLPTRLVKGSLPKIDDGNVDKVLTNTKLGTVDAMLKESKSNVATLGGKIDGILSSSGYASHLGEGSRALSDAAAAFPRSEYTPDDVVQAARSVVPAFSKTITKLQEGTATLGEKNELRSAIDLATKKIFTDSPQVSSTKQLAASLASALRGEVQSIAPETQPVFADLSKELNLRTALASVAKKLDTRSPVNLYSILSFLSGGLPAAVGEEFARSPGVSIAAAKGIKAATPALTRLAVPAGLAGRAASRNNP